LLIPREEGGGVHLRDRKRMKKICTHSWRGGRDLFFSYHVIVLKYCPAAKTSLIEGGERWEEINFLYGKR